METSAGKRWNNGKIHGTTSRSPDIGEEDCWVVGRRKPARVDSTWELVSWGRGDKDWWTGRKQSDWVAQATGGAAVAIV